MVPDNVNGSVLELNSIVEKSCGTMFPVVPGAQQNIVFQNFWARLTLNRNLLGPLGPLGPGKIPANPLNIAARVQCPARSAARQDGEPLRHPNASIKIHAKILGNSENRFSIFSVYLLTGGGR